MSFELIRFTSPTTAQGILRLDSGLSLNSHPAIHQPSGRVGIGFTIPETEENGHGCELTLFAADYFTISQRAILYLRKPGFEYPWVGIQSAAMDIDDFRLPLMPYSPPIPVPPPSGDKTPTQIINEVYATGLYNLTTHDGCGVFTEACCSALHDNHSVSWGHIKKNPGQEQYNGHAIDAIMLLNAMLDADRGIYDIIRNSQSPNAQPSFDRVSDPNPSLWYYPA